MTEEEQQDRESSTIGQYLKSEREKRDLSIKRISQHTKISTTKLELIEEEKFDELPSLAYVTGFVKSYAKTLGLDQNYCMDLLDKAYGIKKEPIPEEQLEKLSDSDKPSIESFNGLPLGKIVAGVAVITLIIGILVFVGQDQTPVVPDKQIRPKSVDSDTPLAESRPPVTDTDSSSEQAQDESDEVIEEEEQTVEQEPEEDAESDEENENEEDVASEEINLRPFPRATFNWDEEMPQSKIDELLPEDKRVGVSEGEHHVYIKAVDGETWLTYKSDDKNIRRFVLKEGRDIHLSGRVHRIFLGNINATEIFINNRPIQVESRTGVKSIVVPREAYTEFSLPLFIYPETGGVFTSEEYKESLAEDEETQN